MDREDQLDEALELGVDVIMLDNLTMPRRRAVETVRSRALRPLSSSAVGFGSSACRSCKRSALMSSRWAR